MIPAATECDEVLLVQAELDGDLDAEAAGSRAAHRQLSGPGGGDPADARPRADR